MEFFIPLSCRYLVFINLLTLFCFDTCNWCGDAIVVVEAVRQDGTQAHVA
jgi:hypothetical protein